MQRSTTALQRIGGAYGKYEHVYECVFIKQILCTLIREQITVLIISLISRYMYSTVMHTDTGV